ncbi:MAG: flavodoxin family protein [Selenomonadaceae bacterium]|nr:flavodoxin family protein [Selenomonadaceae bacterium]
MKKIYAINGSPRKNKNTATLLDKVLEGARKSDPNILTERIDLYCLKYTGCLSCFACKRKGGASYGKCAVRDDLYEVLEKLRDADALVFGSPIYYRTITGQLHSFYERFFFPYMQYKHGYPNLVQKKIPTACVYTMNVKEEEMLADGYLEYMKLFEIFLENYFQKPLILHSFNTYQFDDYSKYVCEVFSEEEKAAWREEHFPQDCQKAVDIGKELASKL